MDNNNKSTHIHILQKDTDIPIIVTFESEQAEDSDTDVPSTQVEDSDTDVPSTQPEDSTNQNGIRIITNTKVLKIDTPEDNAKCHHCDNYPETAYFPRGVQQPTYIRNPQQ